MKTVSLEVLRDEFWEQHRDPDALCERYVAMRIAEEAGEHHALNVQVGGSHYKDLPIQPVEYIHANGIGYFEGNVIKYVSRWRTKGGIPDLRKAAHYLDLLITLETQDADDAGSQG